MEIPAFLAVTGNSSGDRLKAIHFSTRQCSLQPEHHIAVMLAVTQCEKTSKSKQEPIQWGTERSCSHITVLSQLTSLNARSVCTYTEKKLVMPSSPIPCLLECSAHTCSEPPTIQPSSTAASLQHSRVKRARTPERSGCKKKKKPRKYMSLWTLISFHSLFSSVLLSPIIKIK